MTGIVTKIGMGAALVASALTVSAPADAQRYRGGWHGGGYHGGWHGGYRGRGNVAGAALVGGIVGLGVGAAIAGGGPYYGGYGYGYPGYYGPAYYPRAAYRPYWRPRAVIVGRPYAYRRPFVRYGYRRW